MIKMRTPRLSLLAPFRALRKYKEDREKKEVDKKMQSFRLTNV
jgi:hypothetical protein